MLVKTQNTQLAIFEQPLMLVVLRISISPPTNGGAVGTPHAPERAEEGDPAGPAASSGVASASSGLLLIAVVHQAEVGNAVSTLGGLNGVQMAS